VPFSPTVVPVLASVNETPERAFVVPLDWHVQLAPPSAVRRIVPPQPTAVPVLAVREGDSSERERCPAGLARPSRAPVRGPQDRAIALFFIAEASPQEPPPSRRDRLAMAAPQKTFVIIGSGFGGSMTGLALARAFPNSSILILERGSWWTTPVSTVQDKEVKTYDFLARKGQPVQYWSSQNHFRGFIDLFTRCLRRPANPDGLYDLTRLGRPGFLGLFGGENDGVSILRACGVGGGSLVYSNITIRPPDLIFEDPRWPLTWSKHERQEYFDLARHAISYGIVSALKARDAGNLPYVGDNLPPDWVNTGLSNIVARTARLNPHWQIKNDPDNSRGLKQIVPGAPSNSLWIDRARVFQTAMSQLTSDFGAVDLAINDLTPEDSPAGPDQPPPSFPLVPPANYCERQGRCNVGCLPGARHTLNKQLMKAILGKFNPKDPDNGAADVPPEFPNMELQTLAEVDVISALPDGGYEIRYLRRDKEDPSKTTHEAVTAEVVVVAAGCVGTNEILLRSKARGELPNLSARLGFAFSTNGDYIAFLERTKEHITLTRGPVTTSFGHFNTRDPRTGDDPTGQTFHTLEDQGIPPALASMVGQGVPLIRSLGKGRHGTLFVIHAVFRWLLKRLRHIITAPFTNSIQRADIFQSEDEIVAKMMCVVGVGRDESIGQFRLGGPGETLLRVKREDGRQFWEDRIYAKIQQSLSRVAQLLRDPNDPKGEFQNPFLTDLSGTFNATSITVSHPLGGSRMAKDATEGVVDEFGRVFDRTKSGDRPFYQGLYIADASIIPAALGVNPSLTISALALRVADQIIADHKTAHP
jgi:choline dehydrogenase-like flavoprotein